MRYRTNFEGNRMYEELYECNSCGKQYDQYNQMDHPSYDSGGFCHCGSEDIKVLVLRTIYQELWVEQKMPTEDVLEVALELENWEIADFAIRIKGEQT